MCYFQPLKLYVYVLGKPLIYCPAVSCFLMILLFSPVKLESVLPREMLSQHIHSLGRRFTSKVVSTKVWKVTIFLMLKTLRRIKCVLLEAGAAVQMFQSYIIDSCFQLQKQSLFADFQITTEEVNQQPEQNSFQKAVTVKRKSSTVAVNSFYPLTLLKP